MHCGSRQGGNAACADKVEHKLTINDVEYDGSSNKEITLGTAAFRNTNGSGNLVAENSEATLSGLTVNNYLALSNGGYINLNGGKIYKEYTSENTNTEIFSYNSNNGILTINY